MHLLLAEPMRLRCAERRLHAAGNLHLRSQQLHGDLHVRLRVEP